MFTKLTTHIQFATYTRLEKQKNDEDITRRFCSFVQKTDGNFSVNHKSFNQLMLQPVDVYDDVIVSTRTMTKNITYRDKQRSPKVTELMKMHSPRISDGQVLNDKSGKVWLFDKDQEKAALAIVWNLESADEDEIVEEFEEVEVADDEDFL